MRKSSIIIFCFAVFPLVNAQEQERVDTLNFWEAAEWETILETNIRNDQDSFYSEEMSQIADNPIDLNSASVEELHQIPALSTLIASKILERRSRERFTSMNELLEIEGMTPSMLSFVKKFVKAGKTTGRTTIGGALLSRMSKEYEERQGYVTGAYPGSSLKSLNRIRLSIDKISSIRPSVFSEIDCGMLIKKDPGECGLANFSTGYIAFSMPFLSSRIIIGDYQMEAAEGLIFWRGSALGKGSDVLASTRRNGVGIYPKRSSDENSYFRGFGLTAKWDNAAFQVLYSSKPINATRDSAGCLSSFDNSGLFRTESEQQKRNSSREVLLGCRVTTNLLSDVKIGGTFYRTQLKNPLKLPGTQRGTASDLWMHGMDISYTSRNVDLFSECAFDNENSLAVVAGGVYEPAAVLALTVLIRNYPSAFQSIHGNAFGESGRVQNESGIYSGIRLVPFIGLCLSMYYDLFTHDQPSTVISVPSHGNDFLALAGYQEDEELHLSFRYKRKETPSTIQGSDAFGRSIQQVVPRIQKNYRVNGEYTSSESWRVSSRIEWLTVDYGKVQTSGKGLLLAQAIKWNIWHSFVLQARLAIFDSDSYDSAVYEIEDDVPGAFSNPALFGRGIRWYVIFRCQPFPSIHISVKYSQTVKDGVKSLGSGLDEIRGNTQSMVNIQTEVRF